MDKIFFEVGQLVKCINNTPLKGKEHCPPLELEKQYPINQIILDSAGNQHLDVGLKSELEYVTSFETGEQLKDGHVIHWCHPSRFELIAKEA